jgi:D-alanyl-D-alanine carboxypeptidase
MGNFYTDVLKKDPRFRTTKLANDMALLEPVARKLVQEIIADAAKDGIKLMAYETYRSKARQEKLFAQGATKTQDRRRASLWACLRPRQRHRPSRPGRAISSFSASSPRSIK